jgi:hypothetical protein
MMAPDRASAQVDVRSSPARLAIIMCLTLNSACVYVETSNRRHTALWKKKCISGLRFGFCADNSSRLSKLGVDHGQLKELLFVRCVCSS